MSWRTYANSALQRYGYEVHRVDRQRSPVAADLAPLMKRLAVRHVVDVGANEGQFATLVRRETGFEGRIDSFEPVPRTFRVMADRMRGDANWRGHQSAITTSAGSVTLNVFPSSLFNSISATTTAGDAVFDRVHGERFRVVDTVSAPGLPLDAADLPNLGPVLLKLDTQGHDWEALAGARLLLERVVLLVMELSFEGFYESSVPAWESLRRLESAGFGLVAVHPVCRARDDVRLGEADGIFTRMD